MSSQTGTPVYQLSANAQFKAEYNRTLRWSVIAAIVLTIISFAVSPEIRFKPYKLRTEEIEIVDIEDRPDTFELPPPPVEAPPPPKVIEAAPDDEVAEDVDIADSFIDLDQALNSGMQAYSLDNVGEEFVVSQEKPKLLPGGWVKPEYPEMARMAQLQGTVIVKVLVGPTGAVMDAQVVKSVNPTLDRAALDAARRTKWSPGKQRNIPVKAWMALPFNFRLH